MADAQTRPLDSKFRFILLAAHRAEQVMRGARPKMDYGTPKIAKGAMNEVKQGLVEWDYGPAPVPEVPEEAEAGEEAAEAE